MDPHPIRLALGDDLDRSRPTVFFRLLLAIPHYIWFGLWSVGAIVATVVNWFATLITGASPAGLHNFLAAYLRYATHLFGYLALAANPYPPFTGSAGDYPIGLEIDPPAPQRRWVTALRLVLAIPALLLAAALGGGFAAGGGAESGSGDTVTTSAGLAGLAGVIALLAWFACLARARMPVGFQNALAYSLRYSAQAWGYVLMLTDRYPDSNPTLALSSGPEPPPRGVRLLAADDLRRSRLTVFFRLLLALPHLVWLLLWAIVAFLASIVGWFAALFTGRLPGSLHRFLAAFIRYDAHVSAYLFLVANPFPGFTGAPGSYPIDVEVDEPVPQSRSVTFFRAFLAIPAFFVNSALGTVLFVTAVLGWFYALGTGRYPNGFSVLGRWAIRYSVETYGYSVLLTETYPYSSPPTAAEPEDALDPFAVPV